MAGMGTSIERRIRGACALDCPDTCSWIVTVKDGEALTLRGDPDHPATPSGKLELASERMASAGLDPVAGYTAAFETVQRDTPLAHAYPLSLITPADHHFLNSIFANVPDQLRRSGPPVLFIHPADAEPRRIADGAQVRVFNARGSFVAAAAVSDRVRLGVVASPKGRWPGLAGGANVNATVDERDSDMGGGAVFHDNRVQIEALA